jgi:hypothetical protein
MIRTLYSLSVFALIAIIALQICGLKPNNAHAIRMPVYGTAMVLMVIGAVVALWRMIVVDARPIEATNVDVAAVPEREFGYRRQKLYTGIVFALAGILALPLCVIWPLLLVIGSSAGKHPAILILGGVCALGALIFFVAARRGWNARVTIYPDRLEVRGIYSNGSLKWNEATAFYHEEVPINQWGTMWVYFLCDKTHSVRVEYTVEKPDEFVRLVEERTGLKLEERPRGWTPPRVEPVKHKHAAFRK